MSKSKALILASEGVTTNLLYHCLSSHFDEVEVMIEANISKRKFLVNRFKKLGLLKTISQVLFMSFIQPSLNKKSIERQKEIIQSNNRNDTEIPDQNLTYINSVNDGFSIELIKTSNPHYIFVNGTRIISKQVIDSINLPLINIHVGITPKYRGVHGGYWALYNNEPELFGTTLHLIDSGVDTGQIIGQVIGKITEKDSFSTYPIIQYCLGLNLIDRHIEAIKVNQYEPAVSLTQESQLFYHPGICTYLKAKQKRGIR